MSAFFIQLAFAQPPVKNEIPHAGKGNSYAVIIGVAKYLDADINQLQFANRDAEVFADFLMSAPGGSVPKENIKLLIDDDATQGEIENAIVKLKDKCSKDDNVFFYFSGHGALENETMYNDGYLICYNTSAVAFKNMGVSIVWLNKMANTLSVEKNANVIIITDACHSGRVANNKFKGNALVGEQLMITNRQEIRMASCKPDELSIEKADWGGGRGVFSYHLVNGLQGGLADADNNGIVTVGEIKVYLENAMSNDQVLKNDGDTQTAVIKGRPDFQLSTVVQSEKIKIKKTVSDDSVSNAMMMSAMKLAEAEGPADPEEYFFSLLKKEDLEWLTEELKLDSLAAEAIAFTFINELEKRPLTESQLIKLKDLSSLLKNDKEKLQQFNVSLGRTITDKGQNIILQYIKGDEAELERRRYYNIYSSGYDVYPKMFAAALKLSQGDEYRSRISAIFLHYFTGVALRLKIPATANPKPLIEQAFAEQKKALALEEYAAYIYNELGILYEYKQNYREAEKHFNKASQLSPGWALPYSNLCGLYTATGKYGKATAACNTADSLQSGLQSVSIQRGYTNEKQGNQLFAEEYYHNAIAINSRHFLPFERLAYVNMNITNYAMADSFFYEADLRKKGFHFEGNQWERTPLTLVMGPSIPLVCDVDTSILLPTDIFAFFTWGVQEYEKGNYLNAVRILKKVITNDKTNPLVFHYLGKIFYDQQKWEEAEINFKLALKYSKNEDDFQQYLDSVISSRRYPYDHKCFEDYFRTKHYNQVEDHYFVGTIYESWKHVEEAEKFFNDIIAIEPLSMGGYLKLWRLYEKQGRYNEAEALIKEYGLIVDPVQGECELNDFYRRVIERFPDDGNWNYKLGTLLYNLASFDARVPYFDSIVYFPLLNKELFIDLDIYKKLDTTASLALSDRSATGAAPLIVLDDKNLFERPKSHLIPGTHENIPLSGPVYLPRNDGITYLKRAAELLSEKETLADIHFKIGNIYLWAGSKKQAYPYFEKSLGMVPGNANARLTLVDIYTSLYKNKPALEQLNYLFDSSQINFEKRLLLAQFNIHAGWFDKAKQLLDKAEAIHPYVVPEIEDLRGRLNMLNNKPKEAIAFYLSTLDAAEFYPGNVLETYARFTCYTLARLYAKTGNNKEAINWLQSAIDFGFNYSFVLRYDPYMARLHKTSKWQKLMSSISPKKYKSNYAAN